MNREQLAQESLELIEMRSEGIVGKELCRAMWHTIFGTPLLVIQTDGNVLFDRDFPAYANPNQVMPPKHIVKRVVSCTVEDGKLRIEVQAEDAENDR